MLLVPIAPIARQIGEEVELPRDPRRAEQRRELLKTTAERALADVHPDRAEVPLEVEKRGQVAWSAHAPVGHETPEGPPAADVPALRVLDHKLAAGRELLASQKRDLDEAEWELQQTLEEVMLNCKQIKVYM